MGQTGNTNVVLLADHNSVLHRTLELVVPTKETASDNTPAYRKATQAARNVEVDSYMQMGLVDGWPLIHDQSDHPTEMGLTCPTREPRR